MNKVYQTIIDKGNGNCMQAAIASLLNVELNSVPHFLEYGDRWFSIFCKYLNENGYEYDGMLHNKNYVKIINPTSNCFKKDKFHTPSIINKKNMYDNGGVDGYFFASVLSPKYFNWYEGFLSTHAVIVDRDLNILHDTNKEYINILKYPLADFIKYNGVINVYLINRKT